VCSTKPDGKVSFSRSTVVPDGGNSSVAITILPPSPRGVDKRSGSHETEEDRKLAPPTSLAPQLTRVGDDTAGASSR
jgi:hypothetical protein